MIVAFSDAGSRTDAVQASLLVYRAIQSSGVPVRHVRLFVPDQASTMPDIDGIRASRPADVARLVREARRDDRDVVLNVPDAASCDPELRRMVDAFVVTVGPYAVDERAASESGRDGTGAASDSPAWYLGCRRSGGGPAASAFIARMSALGRATRLLPVALPALSRSEAENLFRGITGARVLDSALRLVSALRYIATDRSLDTIDAGVVGVHSDNERGKAIPDARSFVERLRDLADDLEASETGHGPPADILAGAPVLDDWAFGIAPVQVLVGIASGHPSITGGRRVVTTQVVATDNATFARTLSRYYVLGRPAGGAGTAHLQ